MRFKLIVTFVDEEKTDAIMTAARECGATGATIINHARGEGVKRRKTFFGLNLEAQRDMVLFVVEERRARTILERIDEVGEFDTTPGTGIAFQIDIEDAVGVKHQIERILDQDLGSGGQP
ncbi:MAG: P-II family nitrogen regulator [Halorhodospira sp.]